MGSHNDGTSRYGCEATPAAEPGQALLTFISRCQSRMLAEFVTLDTIHWNRL